MPNRDESSLMGSADSIIDGLDTILPRLSDAARSLLTFVGCKNTGIGDNCVLGTEYSLEICDIHLVSLGRHSGIQNCSSSSHIEHPMEMVVGQVLKIPKAIRRN